MPVHPVSEGLKMSLLRLRLNHVVALRETIL